MTDKEYGTLRASAALWAGTSVLITDQRGRVLIQRVDYRTTCLLPGGAVDENESPAQGAARELREELGVTMTVDRGLAVDWVSAAGLIAPADMRFSGEILHVYDGGTWDGEQIAAIQLPDREITSVEFVDPSRLPTRVRSETHQTPEVEKRLRKEVVRLKEALKDSRAAEAASRHRAEQMALAAAVLILRRPGDHDQSAPGNVIPLCPSDD
ncbi:NUDIX domain-containing protein [Streptomyces zhihengii]